MPTEQHRKSYWKLREKVNSEQLPWGEIQTVHHVGECIYPFVVDDYRLVKAELFGGGIIRVELKLDKVGQKAINAQSLEIDRLVHFSGGWRSA
jgi:hypothetical protein